MRKSIFLFFAIFILLVAQVYAQAQRRSIKSVKTRSKVDFPDVPRVSAYEAYVKYKAGKAILIQAGGISYEKRHILGAINLKQEAVTKGRIKLPNFPRKGIEIFTYCY
jgi:hypothetical protein